MEGSDLVTGNVRYYSSFNEDFVETKDQNYVLPEDYEYDRRGFFFKLVSGIVYGTAYIVSKVWCRLFLHVRFKGREKMKGYRGYFIYGNHTQPVGDVFIPALASSPRRIYTVVSPANMALPVIGKILPHLGALPLPQTLSGMRRFTAAMEKRLDDGKVVTVYPEGHVWEYYEGIRPFVKGAFSYPVKYKRPVFSMTVTYKKRRRGRPAATVYIDGPFMPDESLGARASASKLEARVRFAMEERSAECDAEYIEYIKKQA